MGKRAAALLWLLTATPAMAAQQVQRGFVLDSGTVVRLHWTEGEQKARLLAPFGPESSVVRYCIYPSPVCSQSTANPPVTRPATELTRVEVRHGSRAGRGALVGAAVGVAGGLLTLLGLALRDAPAMSSGEQVLLVGLLAASWSGVGALVGAASDNWEPIH